MTGPLDGIRILDLTTVAFGPYASQILGDQGAEVIKIEPPQGDSTRYTGPSRHPGMSAMFLALNRNKKSVVLDLKLATDRERLWGLATEADVVMHNVRLQKAKRIGIDHEAIRARNPRIVYAHLSGFGETGPYAGRPAYDDIIQAMSGGVSLMQRQSGEPRYLPTILADKTSGVVAAQAITAALLARSRHGRGVHVEVPMYETMVAFTLLEHWYGRFFEEHAAQSGYPRALDPSRRPYATRDGYVCVMPYNDRHWKEFWTSAGRTDLADDPRFQTISGRTSNISELYGLLEATLAQGTTEEWLTLCSRLEIPACKVFDVVDIVDDEHLNAVGFFREMDHPSEGRLRMMTSPVLFDGQRAQLSPAPRLGQHNPEYISAGFEQSCRHEVECRLGSAAYHQEPEHQAMAKTVTEGRLPGGRK